MPTSNRVQYDDALLVNANSATVLSELPTNAVLITDPPYGIGHPYASYSDTQDNLQHLIQNVITPAVTHFRKSVITPGISNLQRYPTADWIAAWTWNTTATWGHYGYNQWQPILLYGEDTKGVGSVNGVLKSDKIAFNGGTAKIDHKQGEGHSCPKPLAFMEYLIHRFTQPDDVIVDVFMGSGTTGVAALRTGRRFIGVELDDTYFQTAVKRVGTAREQPFLFAAS